MRRGLINLSRLRRLSQPARAGNRTSGNVLCGWLPRCKEFVRVLARWSGAVLCPACLRGHEPLALMVSADEVPFCFAGLTPWTLRRVVLVPGPTGSPSLHMVLATSLRDTALIESGPQATAEPSAGIR